MFSGFYEALGNVIPESTSSSPSRTDNYTGHPLARDGSPQRQNGESGYSTYQRRSKPSLEERLRASLAAKEQNRLAQEKESASLPPVSQIEEEKEVPTSLESHIPSSLDPSNIPLPTSPPTLGADPVAISMSRPEPSQSRLTAPGVASHAPIAQPVTPPNRTHFPLLSSEPMDPLSPLPSINQPMPVSDPIQELALPPSAVSSTFEDPLTPAFRELEREQQAAVAKARLARSPPPPSSPPKQHHVRNKSNATKPMVADGEPFLRLGSHSQSLSRGSLDQVLYASTSGLGGLGLEGVEDLDGLKAWIEETKRQSQVRCTSYRRSDLHPE